MNKHERIERVATLGPERMTQKENEAVDLDPFTSADELAGLEAARRDFPRYQIDVELALDRRRYVARRIQPGPGQHTLITSNLSELRTELDGNPQRTLPSAMLGHWNDANQGRPHPNWSPP